MRPGSPAGSVMVPRAGRPRYLLLVPESTLETRPFHAGTIPAPAAPSPVSLA
jgi:hypothetical protein